MRFAKFISILFHPLWMPIVIYTIARWCDELILIPGPLNVFILLLLSVNIVAPALSIFIMSKFGMLSDLELRNRNERLGPYMLVLFYFIMSYLVLKWKATFIPPEILKWFFSVIAGLSVALIINQFWKISVHMLAQGGLMGLLLALQNLHEVPLMIFILGSIVIAGLTGYSRVKLEAHTPNQVYAGYLLGLGLTYFIVTGNWLP